MSDTQRDIRTRNITKVSMDSHEAEYLNAVRDGMDSINKVIASHSNCKEQQSAQNVPTSTPPQTTFKDSASWSTLTLDMFRVSMSRCVFDYQSHLLVLVGQLDLHHE